MTVYYADTSALAKRYLNETGSTWVRSWCNPHSVHVTIISQLTVVEMFSLLERRTRDGSISGATQSALFGAFLVHRNTEFLVRSLDDSISFAAPAVIGRHGLRALDGIQLASALDAASSLGEALTFVSADVRLLAAATAEGFATDNPTLHP